MPKPAPLLTKEAVATVLEVSPRTVLRLLVSGVLVGTKVGRQWRVAPADLERYLARSRQTQPAPAAPKTAAKPPRARTGRAGYQPRSWRQA